MAKASKPDQRAAYVDPARLGKRRLKRDKSRTAAQLQAKLVAARVELEVLRQRHARAKANPPKNQYGEPFKVNWRARTTRQFVESQERKIAKLERQLAELEGGADGTQP